VLNNNGVSFTDSTNGQTFAVSSSAQADLGNNTAAAGALTIHDGAGDATTAKLTSGGMLVDDGTHTGTYGANGVTITGGPNHVSLSSAGLDNGNNKIINVAPGALSGTSTDAVNGSQLYATGTSTATNFGGGSTYNTTTGIVTAPTYAVQGSSYNNVGSAIGALDNSVTRLGNRLDRVGAMSAALSGVQPMPFNGENPMQIGIAGGAYNGKYAVALGLNAYASERVLFNLGGAISGGEAMGRVGVSIALGSYKPKAPTASNSEVMALRNVVNTQDAQIQALMRRLDDLENKVSK
jgi:autotransporter adhesin